MSLEKQATSTRRNVFGNILNLDCSPPLGSLALPLIYSLKKALNAYGKHVLHCCSKKKTLLYLYASRTEISRFENVHNVHCTVSI